MRTYTLTVSDDAAALLDEMQRIYGVKPENVLRVRIEQCLSDCIGEPENYEVAVREAKHVRNSSRLYWDAAIKGTTL